MNRHLLEVLRDKKVGSSSKRAILKALCEFCEEDSNKCNPSLADIIRATEVTKKTLTVNLRELEYDKVIYRIPGNCYRKTRYTLFLENLPSNKDDCFLFDATYC